MHILWPRAGIEFYGEWKSSKTARTLPRHKNNGLEIVLVSKGEMTWTIEDRPRPLRPNTFFYTLPWQEHGGVEDMQPNSEITYVCLKLAENYARPRRRIEFHHSLGFRPGEEKAISSAFLRHPRQVVAGDEAAAWALTHLGTILHGPPRLRLTRARDSIKLLLASLANLLAAGHTTESRLMEAERRVGEFITLLSKRFAEPWTLEMMSASCRLGRTQFAELMKKRTGDTPLTYLNRVRIREAQRLLLATELPITEIALAVGFSTSQYFATVFRQFTEMDARHYRARNREQAWRVSKR